MDQAHQNPQMTTTTKIWVVSEYSWEYNDEYMYQPEGNPANAILAFTTEEAAEAKCEELNISTLYSLENLCNYHGNEGWELISKDDSAKGIEELKNFCREIGCNVGDDSLSLNKDISRANVKKLLEKLTLDFFVVNTIAVDQQIPVTKIVPAPEAPPPAPIPEPAQEPELKARNILLEDHG